jgi:hypothetical protein
MFSSFSSSSCSATGSAFEKRMLTTTSAFITLTSLISKRILVREDRLSRWTCRARCQNDVRSANIGYYITCRSVASVLKNFISLCLHRMVFNCYVVQNLFSAREFAVLSFVSWSQCLDLCQVICFVNIFLCVALRPNAGHGFLILEFSRSHTTAHQSRQDSSVQVISSSQRPLPDNTQRYRQTSMPQTGFETAISRGES